MSASNLSVPVRPARRAVVIGAGIVGMSTALFLQRDGHTVTVLDPNLPGQQTSFGNACSISMSSVLPTAMPGMWKNIPTMLRDPAGPLNIRWQYLPRLAPFLLALLKNTSRERVEKNGQAISSLIHHVMDAYNELTALSDTTSFIRKNGALKVYESEASFEASALERELLTKFDCEFDILSPEELGQLEPGLAPIFAKAMYLPQSGAVTNPGRLVEALAAFFVQRGGTIVRERAVDVDMRAGGPRRVLTESGAHETDIIALTAGPWSGGLSKKLGAKVRLEAERGYHIMLQHPPTALNRFVYFADRKFVLTPHEEGLRLTTGVEYSSVDAPPDYRRVRAMLPLAKGVMKDIDVEEQSIWCGNRPTLPDSVPVIGRSPAYDDVYLGFGHSHLGLTMGPVTGRIIADLASDRDPGIDLAPYRPDR